MAVVVEDMDENEMTQTYRPEEGERGDGREPPQGRNGRGRKEGDNWRPPVGSHLRNLAEGQRGASVTSKALAKQLMKSRVESMRDKGPEAPARPKLHIDDGCMGGGEALDHKDYITFDNPYKSYNDFESDYKYGGYFSSDRKDIFHYCIFIDEFWDDYPGYWTDKYGGMGETPGDDFIVADGKYSSNTDIAKVFMHELGHNLDLQHYKNKDSVMYKSASSANVINYHSSEWSTIDLIAFVGSD